MGGPAPTTVMPSSLRIARQSGNMFVSPVGPWWGGSEKLGWPVEPVQNSGSKGVPGPSGPHPSGRDGSLEMREREE